MSKSKPYKSNLLFSILLVIGIGCGLYYSFVFGLYRLEKKAFNDAVEQSTPSLNAPIQKSIELNLFFYYYLRSVK